MADQDHWLIYRGIDEPHDGITQLPEPPTWRTFEGEVVDESSSNDTPQPTSRAIEKARAYLPGTEVVEMVNAALYLRRPLLITGKPGTGKSTLAHHVAYELKLGPVLDWPITTHSSLQDGLYRYDAIGRLQEANLARSGESPDIGRYIRLGPLGTALLPRHRPRVLLIDELDKSDISLPNDLLNVFEAGRFEITELMRLPDDQSEIAAMTDDVGKRAKITRGQIHCHAFPFVVITSNGEREFPPAFLRRCLRLNMQPPGADKLAKIVERHLGRETLAESSQLIENFLDRRDHGDLATDQLLNAIYLSTSGARPAATTRERIITKLFRALDNPAG
jgi:MoxR-like ATPase